MAGRRWKILVAFFASALILSGALTLAATPQYESNARVFISSDTSGGDSSTQYMQGLFATQRVESYAALANSQQMMQLVITKLNLEMTPAQLAKSVQATVETSTVLIRISVTDPGPRTAQRIAQAEADELTTYLADLEKPGDASSSPVKATIVDPATYNARAVSPRTALNLAVAGILGLLIGFSIAVLRDLLDTTIKSSDEAQKASGAPALASVGFNAAIPKAPLMSAGISDSDRAEAFRVLRTNLQFIDLDTEPKLFVVTSALPSEGKTMTSANLAIALAQAGRRVMLVDCDLRRSKLAEILRLENTVGLTTVLVGRAHLNDAIQGHETGIAFLATGPLPPNPAEILQSKAMTDVLARLRAEYDVVILDAPPLLPVADAAILAADADGALLVVRYGRTKIDQVDQAAGRLEAVGARLFGTVLNMTPKRSTSYTYAGGPVEAAAGRRRSR